MNDCRSGENVRRLRSMDQPAELFDVVVVGGGAAGLSTALQLGRNVGVSSWWMVAVRAAGWHRSCTGCSDGTTRHPWICCPKAGPRSNGMGASVWRLWCRARGRESRFVIDLDGGARHVGRRLVVATGLVDELPDISGMSDLWGTGVVTCPYCDGFESRDRTIAVVATQPMSVFQAKLLRQWSSEVIYFSQGVHEPDGDDTAAFAAGGIRIDRRPVAALAASPARAVEAVVTDDGDRVPVEQVIIAPRSRPRDEVLRGLGATVVDGWVQVSEAGQTSVPGLYAVGNDVDVYANVAMSIGAGSATGGAVNADLTMEDTRLAVASTSGTRQEP
ncbi:MAG: NAD(P)/FAD-dependent oxidoreductase [Ilumatobacteraceae bacterium]